MKLMMLGPSLISDGYQVILTDDNTKSVERTVNSDDIPTAINEIVLDMMGRYAASDLQYAYNNFSINDNNEQEIKNLYYMVEQQGEWVSIPYRTSDATSLVAMVMLMRYWQYYNRRALTQQREDDE
jgi:hypothetical protein